MLRRTLQVLEGHRSRIWDLASSVRGDCLASASADGTVRLWRRGGEPEGGELVAGGAWGWVATLEGGAKDCYRWACTLMAMAVLGAGLMLSGPCVSSARASIRTDGS